MLIGLVDDRNGVSCLIDVDRLVDDRNRYRIRWLIRSASEITVE